MVLEKLGDSIKAALQRIARVVFVDDRLINELVKEIQRALLQSDVNVQLVFELSERIKQRAKEEPQKGLTKKEQLVTIVYEELVNFLGGKEEGIDTSKKPTKIMLVGLFGSGKTTTVAKLAKYLAKKGLKTVLLQTDTYRPASLEQLQQLGKKININVYGDKAEKDAVKIYGKFEAELNKADVVIVDTAGRDALSKELIDELNKLAQAVKPQENLLVISADIGQAAQKQAEAFHKACSITGVIVSKLEGTAKGGGALTACAATGAKVKFVGVGEKIDDLERFDPEGFVGRMLGMGDLKALLEKASEAVSEEQAEDLGKKFLKGEFNLVDLYEQMDALKKMGPLSKIMEMIPGMSQLQLPKELVEVQEEKLKKWRYAMNSMSREELENPEIIDSDRIERIAKGSGLKAGEVQELLKQYKNSRKMMKLFKGKGPKQMEKMMKTLGGKRIKFT